MVRGLVVAGVLGAAAGAVAGLGPAGAARRLLVGADRRWWAFYRRALIALGEPPEDFDLAAPDPADVATGLGVFATLDQAAARRAALPGEAELAFRIFTDPDD
ncbi:hypothetical protein ACL02R_30040 [Streptomyces sp. MS19]|uniref:hypothetical protein n=1 Tax=Streptomyces sp. MS19 TaxID=3385972 RepID=UPI00399F7B82